MEVSSIDWSSWVDDLSTIAQGGRSSGRGKRASVIRPSEWERHREDICKLYETKPLEKVQALMRKRRGFAATLSQYKRRLGLWGVEKNRQKSEAGQQGRRGEPTERMERNADFQETWSRFVLLTIVCSTFPSRRI
jgi:hypothetical protein